MGERLCICHISELLEKYDQVYSKWGDHGGVSVAGGIIDQKRIRESLPPSRWRIQQKLSANRWRNTGRGKPSQPTWIFYSSFGI